MKAREFALNVLERVVYEHGYASIIMRNHSEDLSREDMGLVSEIVYGTLRNLNLLDYQWAALTNKKPKKKIRLLIDMSIYQMFELSKIPTYAIVNEAVQLAGRSEKGFVNAILRSIEKQGKIFPECVDELERISIEYSHPLWLIRLWNAHYGMENMLKLVVNDQKRPQIYCRLNRLLRNELDDHFKLVENDCYIFDGLITQTDYFRNGEVLIQDISSQKVPVLLDVKPGMNVLDVCSAPGTKSQQIAVLMQNQGSVTACDLYEERTHLIEQLMNRTGVKIVTVTAKDGTVYDETMEQRFDRILMDVPCSGLGDLSHKPEIRHHLCPENIDELVKTQAAILHNNSAYLKPGGLMVYSTCTLNKKENENQISRFLKVHQDFELMEEHTWFPFEEHGDGFYAAKLRRID